MSSKTDLLRKLFYDPETGLIGVDKLYQKVKGRYTKKQVADFVRRQSVAQQYRQNPKKEHMPIFSNVDGHYQVDLAFLPKLEKFNRGYKIIMTAIELTTKKLIAVALKNKQAPEIERGFRELQKHTKNMKMVRLTSDQGSEFISKEFRELLVEAQVSHYTAQEGDHSSQGVIERVNRTLKQLLSRYMTVYKTKVWIDVLPKLVTNYNNSKHRAIQATPNQVEKSLKIRGMVRQIARNKTELIHNKQLIKVGDAARVLNRKALFDKEKARWSSEVYTVTQDLGKSFTVNGLDGRRFKSYELLRITGAVEENPNEREIHGFDVHQNLDKARENRGKNAVDVPTGKPKVRTERKETSRLVIGKGKKDEEEKVLKKKVTRKKGKVDRSFLKTGVFVYLRNSGIPKTAAGFKRATADNPVFYVGKVLQLKKKGKDVEIQWYKEQASKRYAKEGDPWDDDVQAVHRIEPQPSIVDDSVKLPDAVWAYLHQDLTGIDLIGRTISKHFKDGVAEGTIDGKRKTSGTNRYLWHVTYKDGDQEELNEKQVLAVLVP